MTQSADLTRWNRAGLRHFDYVDGDAAVWLDKLRAALTQMYGRGAPLDSRMATAFERLFLEETPSHLRDAVDIEALRGGVPWHRLRDAIPPAIDDEGASHKLETRGQRALRLDAQYGAEAERDHAWEVMRAFARAAHVTLGHLDAYANEGYLRTATQWDNLRRLAALVNYQPTPAASATSTIALAVKAGLDVVEVAAGLAMKHQPPKGQPLIFETIAKLTAHPDLNAARVDGWDVNLNTFLPDDADLRWTVDDKTEVSPGDVAVMTGGSSGKAGTVTAFNRDPDDSSIARISFADAAIAALRPTYHDARLMLEPDDLRIGQPRAEDGYLIIGLNDPTGFRDGDLFLVRREDEVDVPLRVAGVSGDRLLVRSEIVLDGAFEVVPMAPVAKDKTSGGFTATDALVMYFLTPNGIEMFDLGIVALIFAAIFSAEARDQLASYPVPFIRGTPTARNDDPADDNKITGFDFLPEDDKVALAYIPTQDAKPIGAKVVDDRRVLDGAARATVEFLGKPPKSLGEGNWFVARSLTDGADVLALQVKGIRLGTGRFSVLFDQEIGPPETFEFLGPMKRSATAVGYGRNPDTFGQPALITLTGISDAATDILRPGRQLIISAAEDGRTQDVLASLVTVTPQRDNRIDITLQADRAFEGFTKGDTMFRLNTVQISHGESKGPKTLGSGDGERPRQSFTLQVGEISHIPSAVAESGVIPALDVAVDGEVWPYADYIDPDAEGTRSWSSTLGEDGYLRLHFRRRLPTGTNNVALLRHRVGVGLKGSRIPAFSFTKPMKKSAFVERVYQPFETSGGADRELVESLRSSAPSRLSSNGRAVSLRDFERICVRHASVWRAHAQELATATRSREIMLTVVTAGGAELGLLEADLRASIAARSIPGVVLSFQAYEPILLRFAATIRADLTSHDRTDLQGACETALRTAFALETRDFGQPVYVSEALATLEAVAGVENVIITDFGFPAATGPSPQNVALHDGAIATIFPKPTQVAHIGDLSAVGANSVQITVKDIHDPTD